MPTAAGRVQRRRGHRPGRRPRRHPPRPAAGRVRRTGDAGRGPRPARHPLRSCRASTWRRCGTPSSSTAWPPTWSTPCPGRKGLDGGGGRQPDDRHGERTARWSSTAPSSTPSACGTTSPGWPTSSWPGPPIPPTNPGLASCIDRVFDGETSLQHVAAAMSLTNRLTVIAGGPGTGKTYTIARIIGCAPDPGRRSGGAPPAHRRGRPHRQGRRPPHRTTPRLRRLRGAVRRGRRDTCRGWKPRPSTACSAGFFGRNRFRHDAANRLPHDLVIVDEMSMVSLPMAARVLAATRPTARLVLVGDPDQLLPPSKPAPSSPTSGHESRTTRHRRRLRGGHPRRREPPGDAGVRAARAVVESPLMSVALHRR
jgi:hypothetical protein